MCGISGSIILEKNQDLGLIKKTLIKMKRRGPDNQSFLVKKINRKCVNLLHSRLNIIDIRDRSNQPMTIGNYTIIFNGEIYNYIELRQILKKKNYIFKTNSDTEVLLNTFIEYGEKCVDYLVGMWAFAIWDNNKKKLFLSRDLFGEKPLYYCLSSKGFFFGSEIKFIKTLSNNEFKINKNQIYKNLFLGYKSLNKTNETFYKNIYSLENSTNITIDLNYKIEKKRYWYPIHKIDFNLGEQEASSHIKTLLKKSLSLRMRSDVPIAFCLSGGIDSSFLVSLAKKELNKNVSTYSIIDSDKRYNELENIKSIVNDVKCKNYRINLDGKHDIFFNHLKKLTNYHDGPIATLSYYIHSFLSRKISDDGFKVSISGTGADEIFTGYYDHFLSHLSTVYNHKSFNKNLDNWEKNILPFIRNPNLRDPYVYINNNNNRENIYENNFNLPKFSKLKNKIKFTEIKYSREILRNRMLNELFHETVPVMLKHDDLNSMYYSVENRSPFLDKEILDFSLKIPPYYLIKNGYQKWILRNAAKKVILNKIRLDRQKKGFNTSINSVLNFKKKINRNILFDKNAPINDFVDLDKLYKEIELESIPNHLSKFVFSILSTNIFLKENNY